MYGEVYDELYGEGIKKCEKCGEVIPREITDNWYAYIRVKYCKKCAKQVNIEKTTERIKTARQKAKENRKLQKELAETLTVENFLLKEQIRREKDEVIRLQLEARGADKTGTQEATEKKVREAVELLGECCKSNKRCEGCVFRNEETSECILMNIVPADWKEWMKR